MISRTHDGREELSPTNSTLPARMAWNHICTHNINQKLRNRFLITMLKKSSKLQNTCKIKLEKWKSFQSSCFEMYQSVVDNPHPPGLLVDI